MSKNVTKRSRTNWKRVDATKDREIDYSEIPELDEEFFSRAAIRWPPEKKQLTVRIDADVISWLKAQGKGYQTRLNRILRVAMESHTKSSGRRSSGSQPRRHD